MALAKKSSNSAGSLPYRPRSRGSWDEIAHGRFCLAVYRGIGHAQVPHEGDAAVWPQETRALRVKGAWRGREPGQAHPMRTAMAPETSRVPFSPVKSSIWDF